MKARGSRERDLAGRHRATAIAVLDRKKPPSALDEFRGKKIGADELVSDFDQLLTLEQAGRLGQLDALYVSPGTSR